MVAIVIVLGLALAVGMFALLSATKQSRGSDGIIDLDEESSAGDKSFFEEVKERQIDHERLRTTVIPKHLPPPPPSHYAPVRPSPPRPRFQEVRVVHRSSTRTNHVSLNSDCDIVDNSTFVEDACQSAPSYEEQTSFFSPSESCDDYSSGSSDYSSGGCCDTSSDSSGSCDDD